MNSQKLSKKAHNANILTFCSSTDQGKHKRETCYPGVSPRCISIGGSTFTGEKLTWVNDDVHFWFPGRNVPFTSEDGKSTEYASGSSAATVAASGLAGVLIYSSRLLQSEASSNKKGTKLITRAFTNMATGADRKFPDTTNTLFNVFQSKIREDDRNPANIIEIEALQWNKKSISVLRALLLHNQV